MYKENYDYKMNVKATNYEDIVINNDLAHFTRKCIFTRKETSENVEDKTKCCFFDVQNELIFKM
jgi:hypothetical protein